MKTIRTVLVAAALAAALTSCAGGGSEPAEPAAPTGAAASPAAPGDPAATAEAAFLAYNQALGARDFATMCAVSAPETAAKLVESVTAQGTPVTTCEQAFTALLANPTAAAGADEIVGSLRIDDVTVEGDTAKIAWTANAQGRERTRTNDMRLVEGQWRLLPTGA